MVDYIRKILMKGLLCMFALGFVGCSERVTVFDLMDGDLLFIVNDHGNNITDVTEGVDGLGIDHVAVFAYGNVIEAVPAFGVIECPLDTFLTRLSVREKVLVGRVKGLDVRVSVDNARGFLGLPYDDIFMPSDSAIYCSELVQKSFVFKDERNERVRHLKGVAKKESKADVYKAVKKDKADVLKMGKDMTDKADVGYAGKKCDAGKVNEETFIMNDEESNYVKEINEKTSEIGAMRFVFGTIPMSFHDSTGKVTEFWTKFYAARGLAVPEGEPGTNPGQLSRDPNVKILGKLSYRRSLRQAQ